MRLDFIACKYTHFIQYGKTIEYFFAKRIRNFAEIYNPQNEMFRLLGTKRSFFQNETFFFSHPYPPTLPFSA